MSDPTSKVSSEAGVRQILGELAPEAPADLDAHMDLFESCVIDSFNMIELIERLEDMFAIGFSMTDLTVQNFGTIAAISAIVDSYRQRASAA